MSVKMRISHSVAMLLLATMGSVDSFATPSSSLLRQRRAMTWTTPPTTSHHEAALGGVLDVCDDFFRTQPFLSAFLACSFKASAADFLAQTKGNSNEEEQAQQSSSSEEGNPSFFWQPNAEETAVQQQETPDVNVHRNVAFLLYGGLYQGMFLQFLYTCLYPFLFDGVPFTIPLKVMTDVAIFGPFVTLPLAYILRALIDHNNSNDDQSAVSEKVLGGLNNENNNEGAVEWLWNSVQEGIDKYKNHVETQDLLFQYWSVWLPAQTINQMLVPEHLRVFFVAFVSFFWVYLLSAISSNQTTSTTNTDEEATSTTTTTASSFFQNEKTLKPEVATPSPRAGFWNSTSYSTS